MPRGESLYEQYPDYRVDLEPNEERVRVRLGDQEIADSRRTLLVKETKHPPVVYFPREDVRMDLLSDDARDVLPVQGARRILDDPRRRSAR